MWKERRSAGTTFSRNLKNFSYDVHVVSLRNYFAFAPLRPSVTCGTVEPLEHC
ncbi:putative NADH:ubiquinone reductase (non-electrogenic) [Rosa chinensis]|uniref:Putative NADH:ubiquinone reductase (Non-electrogenic) n=1 Tax=Rosa chinensis TaxID=74649 RepID=A0A2P6PBI1_ROSCH|nr:putative NADH:ubiquinone reductase (non-electrogenic) [Rosa chinensis]